MWDNLPTEITTMILLKLPVKTLIVCTSLSKFFFSLITTHEFINTHIARNPTTHFFLRYVNAKREGKYHLVTDNDNFTGFQNEGLSMPFDCFGYWFSVAGCVNGVICLVDDFGGYEGTLIILWNPSIRKYVHVPEPHYVYESYGQYESACGFGFDSITNDYKVVRVVRLLDREPTETQVEVYSLRSECWRNVGTGPEYRIKGHYLGYFPCFFNGSVHWVGTYRRSSKCENVILKFDMSKETFEVMELPSMLKESLSSDTYVLECKDMLTLIRSNYADNLKTYSVWRMKEYGVVNSWTKMIAFENNECLSRMPRPNGFRHNGEVIIVKQSGGFWGMCKNVIVSFNPATHGEKVLGELAANDIEPRSCYLSTYVESMALFREGKANDDHTKETVKSN